MTARPGEVGTGATRTGAPRSGAPRVAVTDLPNARLVTVVTLALAGGLFLALIVHALPAPWGLPGGPILQGAAALGALLLLLAFAAVFAKRLGRPGKRAFHGHVWLASVGTALVLAHGAAGLDRPPALLLALLALLIGLGVWSRTAGARAMAGTFGQKRAGFRPPDPATRERLQAILRAKQALLARIDAAADERLFAPAPRHWRSAPLKTLRYQWLAERERTLTGARAALSPLQARWRLVHHLAGLAFVGGLVAHVVIVMVFAGYAAHDGAPYWLHFWAMDF